MIENRNLLFCIFLIHLINDELGDSRYFVQYDYNIANMANNGQNACEISRKNKIILESVGYIVLKTVR